MRLGIIARGEDRGLGNQTYEACRHLNPDRVLLIDPGPDRRFTQHPERFTAFDTTLIRWMPGFVLDEHETRQWLTGLDVVYTAETPYDDRLPQWASEVGCRVVIHANVEQLSPDRVPALAPAVWWAPTAWRLDRLPPGTRVVPMPVATSQTPELAESERVRFLHVGGWPTAGDRNGTKLVVEAIRHLRSDCEVIIRGQHKDIRRIRPMHGPARLTLEAGNLSNYWTLYRDADVLVLPRRFGGLSLVAQEAMASGLGLVMPDCSPNETWPCMRVPAQTRSQVWTPAGGMALNDVDPHQLAAALDQLASEPESVAQLKRRAATWAQANTWEQLKDVWLTEMQLLIEPAPSAS